MKYIFRLIVALILCVLIIFVHILYSIWNLKLDTKMWAKDAIQLIDYIETGKL